MYINWSPVPPTFKTGSTPLHTGALLIESKSWPSVYSFAFYCVLYWYLCIFFALLRERVYDVYNDDNMYTVLIYTDRLFSITNVVDSVVSVPTALWFAGCLQYDMTINIIHLKSELRHIFIQHVNMPFITTMNELHFIPQLTDDEPNSQ